MLILFPLKLGLSNMLFNKTYRARQRQPVSIRLIDVDMMHDPRFPEICLDEVKQHCLPYNMKTMISQVKRRIPGNEVVLCDITNTVPADAYPVTTFRILI